MFEPFKNEAKIRKAFRAAYKSATPELKQELENLIRARRVANFRLDTINLIFEIKA